MSPFPAMAANLQALPYLPADPNSRFYCQPINRSAGTVRHGSSRHHLFTRAFACQRRPDSEASLNLRLTQTGTWISPLPLPGAEPRLCISILLVMSILGLRGKGNMNFPAWVLELNIKEIHQLFLGHFYLTIEMYVQGVAEICKDHFQLLVLNWEFETRIMLWSTPHSLNSPR